ncbi:MAG: YdcF family protein [Candidatus Saccharimonas sp.]
MMKLFRRLAIILVLLALAIWGISHYLGPDDLQTCQDVPSDTTGCGVADAIIALSGGDTSARADEAITLYQHGWAPLLIFSGAAADKSGPSNAEVMQRQAIAAGVPSSAIIIETRSENTSENAAATSDILTEQGIKSAILVTSAYHQRRASIEFGRRVPDVSVRSHPVAADDQWGPWWWLTPTGWFLAIPELARSLYLMAGGGLNA